MQQLVDSDLSEPYSIFTYRYFLHSWPTLSYLAMEGDDCIGCIICKMEPNHRGIIRGYIAMLAVRNDQRKKGLGSRLVQRALKQMYDEGCEEVTLEAEETNRAALNLYERLGFLRDKRLVRTPSGLYACVSRIAHSIYKTRKNTI
mmetsp:Transcript_22472/g.55688  ORF Transcript_22472/g.55688 Transcript_22472/m.55688 type:complete len:145 (-) Transcript_22472:2821-3255(-)